MFEHELKIMRAAVDRLVARKVSYCMILREHAEFVKVPYHFKGQKGPLPAYVEPKTPSERRSTVRCRVYDLYKALKRSDLHGIDWQGDDQGQGGISIEDINY